MSNLSKEHSSLIQQTEFSTKNIAAGTTVGLEKRTNEDVLHVDCQHDVVRISLADGHWGPHAAETSVQSLSKNPRNFPADRASAIQVVEQIQSTLYEAHGSPHMNPNKDLTPETSLLAVEVGLATLQLNYLSYGDCRLNVFRDKKKIFEMHMIPTWLGAFSYLRLRGRKPVSEALVHGTVKLKTGDIVLAYTDGVDECVYETPTLQTEDFERLIDSEDPDIIFNLIMQQVFLHGAEDNASLAVVKI